MTPRIFIDVETTGLHAGQHAIREIAIIVEIDGMIVETIEHKMRPHSWAQIDYDAMKKLGVDTELLKYLPCPKLACEDIVKRLKKYNTAFHFIAHNADFDFRFVQQYFTHHDYPEFFRSRIRPVNVCTLRLAKSCLSRKSYSLKNLCEYFKIELKDAHTALADCKAMYELFYKLDTIKSTSASFIDESNYDYLKQKYLNSKYIVENDGIWIRPDAIRDPMAMRFLLEELGNRFV